jgi:hypothetical protein
MTFSWTGISLGIGGETTRSVIAKFGFSPAKQLGLVLTFPVLHDGELFYHLLVTITGSVTSADSTDRVTFLVVVDDPSTAYKLVGGADYAVNNDIEIPFRISDYPITGSPHQLSFYAVDAIGNLSPLQSWIVTVVAPTPSVPASHSPSPSVSPHVNVPITVTNNTRSFDIFGQLGDNVILTTVYGYQVILRIDNDLAYIWNAVPTNLSNVFLSVSWRYIRTNAILLILRADNANGPSTLIDIGVATDVNFDGQDDALITAIDGRHGFSILSEKNVLTVITGGYPLVTTVSTSWFGVYWTAGGMRGRKSTTAFSRAEIPRSHSHGRAFLYRLERQSQSL